MKLRNTILAAGLMAAVGNLVLFAVMGVGLSGQERAFAQPAAQAEVRAERFVLVDPQGRERAKVWMGRDGDMPSVCLYDSEGKPRAVLSVDPDGSPGLFLYDPQVKPRAALAVLPDGSPALSLHDPQGKGGATLAVLSDGSGCLWFTDANGRGVWSAP